MIAFDHELARRSHMGTSFDPDLRAAQEQQQHDAHLAHTRAELAALATTDAQRAILDAGMVDYTEGYTRRYNAYLAARGRCLSPMITGPARFNTRRNDRAFAVEQGRTRDLNEYAAKATKRLRAAILAARTEDAKDEQLYQGWVKWAIRDMAMCASIDTGPDKFYNRSAFVNSAAGKLRREITNGHARTVARVLAFIDEQQKKMIADGRLLRPFISPRHGVWAECAAAVALLDAAPVAELAPTITEDGEILIAECDAARAIRNPAIDRVQIIFPGKPDEAIRRELRGSGWNWSPTNGAWQRKDTPNAVAVAGRLIASMS